LKIAKGEIIMIKDNGNIANLETGDVLPTEQSDILKQWSEEAVSTFGDMHNMTNHEKQLHKDMLSKLSVDTEMSIDDFTWDGSGD
jgi:hypothetical protein